MAKDRRQTERLRKCFGSNPTSTSERDQEALHASARGSMLRKENERLAGLLHDLKKHFPCAKPAQ